MDDMIFMGHGWPEGMKYRKDKLESVSGWLTDRTRAWTCERQSAKSPHKEIIHKTA